MPDSIDPTNQAQVEFVVEILVKTVVDAIEGRTEAIEREDWYRLLGRTA